MGSKLWVARVAWEVKSSSIMDHIMTDSICYELTITIKVSRPRSIQSFRNVSDQQCQLVVVINDDVMMK